jgi:hypothetical protein
MGGTDVFSSIAMYPTAGDMLSPPVYLEPRYYSSPGPVRTISRKLRPLILAISTRDHPRYVLIGIPDGVTNRIVHSMILSTLQMTGNSLQITPPDRPFYWLSTPLDRQSAQHLRHDDDRLFVLPYDNVVYIGEDILAMAPMNSATIVHVPYIRRGLRPKPQGGGPPGWLSDISCPGSYPLGIGSSILQPTSFPPPRSVGMGPLPGTGLRQVPHSLPSKSNDGGWVLVMLPRNRSFTHAQVRSTILWSTVQHLIEPAYFQEKVRIEFSKDYVKRMREVPQVGRRAARRSIKEDSMVFLPLGNTWYDNMLYVHV